MAKDYVIIKGRVVRMNEAAFKIASKHFGATRNRPDQKHVPIELLKMPKLPIIPAVRRLEKVELPPVELPPVEDKVPVEISHEATEFESNTEKKPVRAEVKKKPARRKK